MADITLARTLLAYEPQVDVEEPTGKSAAKKGTALLSGLLRCGHCGRKMFVAYSGKGGRRPRYSVRCSKY